jgi:hypothetical protein
MFRKLGYLVAVYSLAGWSAGLAAMRSPTPVTVLAKRADVVVLATIKAINGGGAARVTTLQLQLVQTLKGQLSGSEVAVTIVPPSQTITRGITLAPAFVGKMGLWFLRGPVASGDYEIIPTAEGLYSGNRDLFFPLDAGAMAAQVAGTLDQQVLAYLVRWYQSLGRPSSSEDDLLLKSLDPGLPGSAAQADSLAAISPLRGSVYIAQQIVGLAAAIPLGDDQAIPVIVNEIATLQNDPKFPLITRAVRGNVSPLGAASLAALGQLIAAQPNAPGLAAAAGSALAKSGNTASVLPAMAALLNATDPEAQLRAAAYFGRFALFADAKGQVNGDNLIGPWATSETRQFTPRNDSGITPAQYAQFWQGWWTQNKKALGF